MSNMSVIDLAEHYTDPKLSPSQDIEIGLLGTGSAGVIMQNYVNTILSQKDLILDFFPALPTYQEVARENAIYWRDNLQPKVYSTISGVIDFGNEYNSYYNIILKLVKQLQENSDNNEAKRFLKKGIENLREDIIKKQVYTGTADLYCFFYARALELLRKGGMLAFISSNKWFRAKYGEKLRKYIDNNCNINSITDFGELPVFKSAATFPTIFIGQNEKNNNSSIFTQVKSLNSPYPDVLKIIKQSGYLLPPNAIKGSDWMLTFSFRTSKCNMY